MLIAAAVLPSLVIMIWFHRRDAHPEPLGVLWRTAGLEILSVIPVLIVAIPTGMLINKVSSPLAHGTLSAFFSAAVPEEFFKFLVVTLYAARHREFDEPMDGVVYGVAASLGFATLENIMYVADGGFGVAILRAFTSVPAHALFGAIMGLHVGRARFDKGRTFLHYSKALIWPILLHGLYDVPLLSMQAAVVQGTEDQFSGLWLLIVPVVLIGSMTWVRHRVGRLRAGQLDDDTHLFDG